MPASRSVNGFSQLEKTGSNVKEPVQTQRTASTGVARYIRPLTTPTDAHRARTACLWRHQLRLSDLGLLNGLGFVRGLGLARDLGFVGPGMGNCLGLGCCLRHALPTTSLTSTVQTCRNGVMQNHQPETISTWPQNSAAENFLNTDPISSTASRRHPFWCPPYCFRMFSCGSITEQLQTIELVGQLNMTIIAART